MMPFGRRRAISCPVRVPGQEDAVDPGLANAAGDELAVLAAEIEHDDRIEVRRAMRRLRSVVDRGR